MRLTNFQKRGHFFKKVSTYNAIYNCLGVEVQINIEHDGDKISDYCYFTHIDGVYKALLEALGDLILGHNPEFLLRLSMREIENYLRDENQVPVLEEKQWSPWQYLPRSLYSQVFSPHSSKAPLVCHCLNKNYRDAEEYILNNSPRTFDLFLQHSLMGSVCGLCSKEGGRKISLQYVWDSTLAKVESGYYLGEDWQKKLMTGDASYPDITELQEEEGIEAFISRQISPFIEREGGVVKLVDYDRDFLYLALSGECRECSSRQRGTRDWIQSAINQFFPVKSWKVLIENT